MAESAMFHQRKCRREERFPLNELFILIFTESGKDMLDELRQQSAARLTRLIRTVTG